MGCITRLFWWAMVALAIGWLVVAKLPELLS
jgi:hypothetical protein